MRLRLNVEVRFLGYYFHVSERTASRAFKLVLPIMSARFKSLMFWPSREKLFESMPLQFRESQFGKKVSVTIDCFDVLMEAPSNPVAAAQVYSHYKKSKRVMFLIGVAPPGTITFISTGYGGRASDKFITEDSDFVRNLLPGDIVLADKGFLIHDSVRFQQAEILMPAFKKNLAQLAAEDVVMNKLIPNLRIHVERVIGYLRAHFKILATTLPIEFFYDIPGGRPMIDHIVRVCCAISNLYPAVVIDM